jgi:hypothetical protein
MAKKTAFDLWIEAQNDLKLAKVAGGVTEALEELIQRGFISSEAKQEADERAIVFAVPDQELRRGLIRAVPLGVIPLQRPTS